MGPTQAYRCLGQIYEALGQYEKSQDYCLQASKASEASNHIPENQRSFAEIISLNNNRNNSRLTKERGFLFKGLKKRETRNIYQKPKAQKQVFDEKQAFNLYDLGMAFEKEQDYLSAFENYLQALEIFQAIHGERNYRMAYLYDDLARLCEYLNDDEKLIEYRFKAYDLNKSLFGDELLKTLEFYKILAAAYFNLGSEQEAYYYLNSAAEIIEKVDGEKHPSLKYYYESLAILSQNLGDEKKAEEHLQAALSIEKDTLSVRYENKFAQVESEVLSHSSLEKNNDEIDIFFAGLE